MSTESINPIEKRINDPSLKLNCFSAKKVGQLPSNCQYIDTNITLAHNKACNGWHWYTTIYFWIHAYYMIIGFDVMDPHSDPINMDLQFNFKEIKPCKNWFWNTIKCAWNFFWEDKMYFWINYIFNGCQWMHQDGKKKTSWGQNNASFWIFSHWNSLFSHSIFCIAVTLCIYQNIIIIYHGMLERATSNGCKDATFGNNNKAANAGRCWTACLDKK